jgi:hypothetical protein
VFGFWCCVILGCEYLFNICLCFLCLEVGCVGKLAVVTVELVEESFAFSDGAVAEELLGWFREAVAVPWVKEVRRVVVKRF